MLWPIPADTHRQRIGILANHPVHISGPAPATNVSATSVLATAAGIGKALAETAETPPTSSPQRFSEAAGIGSALAETAETPPASAQGGGHGGADRRCQPFPPRARRVGRVDQVLPHLQRAMR